MNCQSHRQIFLMNACSYVYADIQMCVYLCEEFQYVNKLLFVVRVAKVANVIFAVKNIHFHQIYICVLNRRAIA